jgi:toxin ParE1/3/4
MADYELKLLAPAWEELEAIADRHLNLVGPDSAQKITEKLLDSLENLKINPLLGIECTDKIIALDRYRKLICGNYLCFYRIIENTVYVYHIVDGRTDYPKIFEDT